MQAYLLIIVCKFGGDGPFACEKKRFAQKFTDGRTDRRRTPRHCISSFLELAKNDVKTAIEHEY